MMDMPNILAEEESRIENNLLYCNKMFDYQKKIGLIMKKTFGILKINF